MKMLAARKLFGSSNLHPVVTGTQLVLMSNPTVVNQPDISQYWAELLPIPHCWRMSTTWGRVQPVVPVSRWGRGRTVRALFALAWRMPDIGQVPGWTEKG